MRSLGTPRTSSAVPRRGISLKMGTLGMFLMLLVFLVAVVFAANQNDVVGWLVVLVSLGWLLIFTFVVFSVRAAAKNAGARLNGVQESLNRAAGRPSGSGLGLRDEKLDHSFKIVQVQVGVVRSQLGRAPGEADHDMVDRALETIEITAHNARGMLKDGNDDGPVSGTVVG